jgi:hypothetical protein
MTRLTLPELTDTTSSQDHFNIYQESFEGDQYPRDEDGNAEDLAASLGSDTYPWQQAAILNGWLQSGVIVPWYDYDGLIPLPQGYMRCNGVQINQENYDAQHSSGDWLTFVGSSPRENLYTPNLSEKFIKGTTGATQDGSAPITTGGNPGNLLDLTHDHGGIIETGTSGTTLRGTNGAINNWGDGFNDTHTHTFTIPEHEEIADVTPLSIEVQFLIRVVE